MFKGKSIFAIIHIGGLAMYVLIFCSILSLAVILERLIYYKRQSRLKRAQLMEMIRGDIQKGHFPKAIAACKEFDTPFAKVACAGLNLHGHNERLISQAMEREITIETIKLEKFTSVVGTIGSTAVYIGLFGTVMGIIRAFHDISLTGAGGADVVTTGISEALICTAAGLLVSIPAVISYNFFIRKIDNFVRDMELCASELVDFLCVDKK